MSDTKNCDKKDKIEEKKITSYIRECLPSQTRDPVFWKIDKIRENHRLISAQELMEDPFYKDIDEKKTFVSKILLPSVKKRLEELKVENR